VSEVLASASGYEVLASASGYEASASELAKIAVSASVSAWGRSSER
jgi:hypothetical protein